MKKRIELVAAVAAPVLAALACLVPVAGMAQVSACTTEVVASPAGPVCGTRVTTSSGKQAEAFLGIPFAESTAGEKRWTPPVPKARWTQTLAAVRHGAICPQTPQAPPPQQVAAPAPPSTAQSRKMLNARATAATAAPVPPQPPTEDEDCLSLNVWMPAGAAPDAGLPVIVFIYGGSFVAGSSADPMYDGAHLAANQNVILVSFNYRLGVLGFLAADRLAGNYGFMDQQAALTWVRDNIRSFGGDPAKVTIFGESAGAMSVGLHLFSAPGSVPLFRAAIMQSNFFSLPYKRLADQINVGNIFRQGLNCRDVACLRKTPMNDIVTGQYAFVDDLSDVFSGTQYYIPFGPTIDGTVLTRQPVSGAAMAALKPILLGTNKDEALLFTEGRSFSPAVYASDTAGLFGLSFQSVIARYPAQNNSPNEVVWGEVQTNYFLICSTRHVAASAKAPVYAYLFNRQPSFKVWGKSTCRTDGNVCHGDELPFVFHSADKIGGQFTADEAKLSDTMMRYWTNFARYLDPNGAPATKADTRWPRFGGRSKDYLALNVPNISVAADPYRETCGFWDGIGYELMNPWAAKPK